MLWFYPRNYFLIVLTVPQPSPLPDLLELLPDLLKLLPEPPRDDLQPRPERLRVSCRPAVAPTKPPRATLLTRDRFGCNSHTSFRKVR